MSFLILHWSTLSISIIVIMVLHVCSLKHQGSTDLGDGWLPTWHQAMTWNIDDLVSECLCVHSCGCELSNSVNTLRPRQKMAAISLKTCSSILFVQQMFLFGFKFHLNFQMWPADNISSDNDLVLNWYHTITLTNVDHDAWRHISPLLLKELILVIPNSQCSKGTLWLNNVLNFTLHIVKIYSQYLKVSAFYY